MHGESEQEKSTGPPDVSLAWKSKNGDITGTLIVPLFFGFLLIYDYHRLPLYVYRLVPLLLPYAYILYHCITTTIPQHNSIQKFVFFHAIVNLFLYTVLSMRYDGICGGDGVMMVGWLWSLDSY